VFIGAAIALKLYLWPLTVWFLATRRFRSAVVAGAVGAIGFLAVLPFISLGEYTAIVKDFTAFSAPDTYTLHALLAELGAPHGAARVIGLAVGIAVLIVGRRSFAMCIAASLLLTPVVWMHFFAILVVAVAAAGVGLEAWALLPLFWFGAGKGNGATWQLFLVLVLVAAVLVTLSSARWRPVRKQADTGARPVEQA
jgi:hypothetical protein